MAHSQHNHGGGVSKIMQEKIQNAKHLARDECINNEEKSKKQMNKKSTHTKQPSSRCKLRDN